MLLRDLPPANSGASVREDFQKEIHPSSPPGAKGECLDKVLGIESKGNNDAALQGWRDCFPHKGGKSHTLKSLISSTVSRFQL